MSGPLVYGLSSTKATLSVLQGAFWLLKLEPDTQKNIRWYLVACDVRKYPVETNNIKVLPQDFRLRAN